MADINFVTPEEVAVWLMIAALSYVLVSRLITAILLSSRFADFYYDHLFQLSMDAAYAQGDAARINSSQYKAKLTQLGARRINLREAALGYFENEVATPQLVKRLIQVLPRQGRPEIQIRMARLLVTTLERLHPDNPQVANQHGAKRLDLENRTRTWGTAGSYLVPVVVIGGAAWLNFDRLRVEIVLGICVGIWLASAVILRLPIKGRANYLRAITVTAGGIAASLWLYATPHLTDKLPTPALALNEIGLSDIAVNVKYPMWVTEEAFSSCANVLSVSLLGSYPGSPPELIFDFDFKPEIITLLASDCHAPSNQTISSSNSVADYHLQLLTAEPLLNYQTILVTPTVRTALAAQPIPIDKLRFQMRLEHPFWDDVRRIGLSLTGLSAGSTALFYLVQLIYKNIAEKRA